MRAKAHPTSLTVEFLKRGNGEFYYFDDSTIDYLKKAFHSDFHTNFCQKSSRESFLPKKGDVILFLWKEHCEKYHMSHIGIVKEYKEGVIETIEGNTSDNMLVEKRMRNYDAQVIGFLRWNGQ